MGLLIYLFRPLASCPYSIFYTLSSYLSLLYFKKTKNFALILLLQDVSSRLKSLLREEDIVSKLGADEFALVIGDITDKSYVKIVSKRIIDEIRRDYNYLQDSLQIGISIGIGLFPKDAQEIDTLINSANEAMYEVKRTSKNAYLFYSEAKHNGS